MRNSSTTDLQSPADTSSPAQPQSYSDDKRGTGTTKTTTDTDTDTNTDTDTDTVSLTDTDDSLVDDGRSLMRTDSQFKDKEPDNRKIPKIRPVGSSKDSHPARYDQDFQEDQRPSAPSEYGPGYTPTLGEQLTHHIGRQQRVAAGSPLTAQKHPTVYTLPPSALRKRDVRKTDDGKTYATATDDDAMPWSSQRPSWKSCRAIQYDESRLPGYWRHKPEHWGPKFEGRQSFGIKRIKNATDLLTGQKAGKQGKQMFLDLGINQVPTSWATLDELYPTVYAFKHGKLDRDTASEETLAREKSELDEMRSKKIIQQSRLADEHQVYYLDGKAKQGETVSFAHLESSGSIEMMCNDKYTAGTFMFDAMQLATMGYTVICDIKEERNAYLDDGKYWKAGENGKKEKGDEYPDLIGKTGVVVDYDRDYSSDDPDYYSTKFTKSKIDQREKRLGKLKERWKKYLQKYKIEDETDMTLSDEIFEDMYEGLPDPVDSYESFVKELEEGKMGFLVQGAKSAGSRKPHKVIDRYLSLHNKVPTTLQEAHELFPLMSHSSYAELRKGDGTLTEEENEAKAREYVAETQQWERENRLLVKEKNDDAVTEEPDKDQLLKDFMMIQGYLNEENQKDVKKLQEELKKAGSIIKKQQHALEQAAKQSGGLGESEGERSDGSAGD